MTLIGFPEKKDILRLYLVLLYEEDRECCYLSNMIALHEEPILTHSTAQVIGLDVLNGVCLKNKFSAFSPPSSCLGSYHFLDLFSSQASVETSVKDMVGPFVTKRKPFEQKLSTHNNRKAIHAKLSQMIFTIRHT